MSFAIQKGETLGRALGRIAAEEMDAAQRQLRLNGGAPIHSARKALKRLRALLRSVRVAFPRDVYNAENERLGEAGRRISPVRDTHVQLEMLRKLEASKNSAARELRHSLLHQQSRLARKMPQLRRSVRAMLDSSRDQMSSWPLQAVTARGLAGLRRIYKEGHKARHNARKNPTAENFHHWRKKAKALGYGFELIEDIGPKKISQMLRRTGSLSDHLGDEHDLFVLLQVLRAENQSNPDAGFLKLADDIGSRRAKLQKRALEIGEKIYSQKPAAFEKNILSVLKKTV